MPTNDPIQVQPGVNIDVDVPGGVELEQGLPPPSGPLTDPILVGQGIPIDVDVPGGIVLEYGSPPITQLWGNTIQDFQLPSPRIRPRFAAAIMRGHDGIEAVPIAFTQYGYPVHQPQPPFKPRRPGAAMFATGERLDYQPRAQTFAWQNDGWEVRPPEIPKFPNGGKRAAAIMPHEDGIERPSNTFLLFQESGGSPFLYRALTSRYTRGALWGDRLEIQPLPQTFGWKNDGWEIQSFQPPEKPPRTVAAMFATGERLDQQPPSQTISWLLAGWEIQPPQPPAAPRKMPAAIMQRPDGHEAVLPLWRNDGWEIRPPEIPHPKGWRMAAFAPRDDGIEAPFVAVTQPLTPWAFEAAGALLLNRAFAVRNYQGALTGEVLDKQPRGQVVGWLNYIWQIADFQPPRMPRLSPAVIFASGDRLDQQPPGQTPTWIVDGWPVQSVQPPRPSWYRAAAWMPFFDAHESPMPQPPGNWGFAVQDIQPPWHRSIVQAAIARGDDGVEFTLFAVVPMGFGSQAVQPPHPRPERMAALMRGVDGIDYPFLLWTFSGHGAQDFQPPRIKTKNFAAGNNEATLFFVGQFPPITAVQMGFDLNWGQFPNTLRRDRLAAMFGGDPGVEQILLGWTLAGGDGVFLPPQPHFQRRFAVPDFAWKVQDTSATQPLLLNNSWGFEAIAPIPLPNIAWLNAKHWGAIDRSITSRIIDIGTGVPPAPPPAMVTTHGYPAVPLWQPSSPHTWSARLGDILRSVRQGKQNVTLNVTLRTGQTTTVIVDVRISAVCGLILVPLTANAVAIQSSVYVSSRQAGQATLTHNSTGNTDCNFELLIIG